MKERLSKYNSVPIVLIFILIVRCQSHSSQNAGQDKYDTLKRAKKTTGEKSAPALHCDTSLVNQEFSFGALAFDVFKADTAKIKSLFTNPVTLKLEKQTDAGNGLYYLYDFTDGVNKIVLYNNEGFLIEDADIKNSNVLLNKKISIGMKKDVFLELLKVKDIKCDTLIVVDEEMTFESIYIFNNAKLQELKMGQIVE